MALLETRHRLDLFNSNAFNLSDLQNILQPATDFSLAQPVHGWVEVSLHFQSVRFSGLLSGFS
jgi:hypothetical protein